MTPSELWDKIDNYTINDVKTDAAVVSKYFLGAILDLSMKELFGLPFEFIDNKYNDLEETIDIIFKLGEQYFQVTKSHSSDNNSFRNSNILEIKEVFPKKKVIIVYES